MFINKLQLKNFKRFTDLTVDLAPQPPKGVANQEDENLPKLVLLIGANGSGKSCIFDAFEAINTLVLNKKLLQANEKIPSGYLTGLGLPDNDYCSKKKDIKDKNGYELIIDFDKEKHFNFHYKSTSETNIIGESSVDTNLEIGNYFYGRSAFRYTPRINKTTIGSNTNFERDLNRPKTYIDVDTKRFDDDIDKIFNNFLKEIKQKNNAQENFNNALNTAFINIFGDTNTSLRYEDFDSPVDGQSVQFWFKKGSLKVPYDYLSAGEKMVFELLLNLYARKHLYQDSIVFFDEIDLHLNTSLQFDLLKEITENWIPDNSQVWIASHSLGFIDYARQYERGVIIDFDSLDFDREQVLKPESKGLKNYEIAVPANLIQDLFRGKQIFICENKNDQIFNSLLLAEKLFVGVHDKNSILIEVKKNTNYFALRDRDYLTDEEIRKAKEKYKNLFILDYYCIENYLYHPENLLELNLKDFDIKDYEKEIINQNNLKKEKIKIDHLKDDRKSDLMLKEIQPDKNYDQFIAEYLDSDNFNKFYTFFNMKNFNGKYLEKYQITEERLAKTNWFKTKISEVLQ